MILKQKLKSYLRRKLSSLLGLNVFKAEFAQQADDIRQLSERIALLGNEIRTDLGNFRSDTQRIHDQYGQWIGQLFNYIGGLHIFATDTNERLAEMTAAFAVNSAYMGRPRGKKRKVVYTCLTGNYDNLPLHPYLDGEWDYVCFTDSSELLEYGGGYGAWRIEPLAFNELDNTKNNRWHKIHPHILFPDYEESIYIDANIAIKSGWIFSLISQKREQNKILIPIHYEHDCIFKHIEFCVNVIQKETRENADKVIAFLHEKNFPANYGLNENNLIYRRHNDPQIISLMDEWWHFIERYSKRDQLSLSYVLFCHGIRPADIAIPNLRPLFSHFRIDWMHRSESAITEPSAPPDYAQSPWQLQFSVETVEAQFLYYRRAGWVALDGDFDVWIKANRYFYKAGKVVRQDVADRFGLSRSDVGFDVTLSFFDAGEGEIALYVADHAKKQLYVQRIQ